MNTQELIVFICFGAGILAVALVFFFLFYKHKLVGRNRLKLEAPIMKGRASVFTDRFGWCESIAHDLVGNNAAILHLKDDLGNEHQTEPVFADELVPTNVFQNINGPGNQRWRYVPKRERSVLQHELNVTMDHLRQEAALSKESELRATGLAKQASVNIEQEVKRRNDHALAVSKANQQQVTKR